MKYGTKIVQWEQNHTFKSRLNLVRFHYMKYGTKIVQWKSEKLSLVEEREM